MRKLLGAAMIGVFMMLAGCGGGVLKTQTFSSSQTVTLPSSVTMLATVSGKGEAGSPGYVNYEYNVEIVTTKNYSSGAPSITTSYDSGSGSPPSDYCDGIQGRDSRGAYSGSVCYSFSPYSSDVPPSTGASATGFNRTFAGGTGSAAPVTTYENVPITSGAPYSLYIPSGGSITISYYE